MKLLISSLVAVTFLLSYRAEADMIIVYSEVGSDLVMEYSGSLNFNRTSAFQASPLAALGNQSPDATSNSVFYSGPTGYASWGEFTTVTASGSAFWGLGVSYDFSGNTAAGSTFLFRYNTAVNAVQMWGAPSYSAGDLIQGILTLGGYSIASSGIMDWSVDLGNGRGTIGIQAKTTAVPEPATLALLGLGLAGMGLTRRRKKA